MTSGDTILGLFDSAGTLLQSDDDGGLDQGSLITSSLGAGTYSISVSKFGFSPENGGVFSGSTSRPDLSYTLEVNFA